ncbi:MAG TPA: ABC transporter permease, partial [Cyclobacteriaceae bacterium]
MKRRSSPPRLFLRFFRWYCSPKLVNHIEGDLVELYNERLNERGKVRADAKFIIDVLLLCRPGIIRPVEGHTSVNTYGMLKSYFKVGWRTMLRSKAYSLINIGGLAAGMTVTILIGLWIWDELSFNKNFVNYDRVAQVWQFVTFDVEKSSYNSLPIPLSEELRSSYPDFERVSMSSYTQEVILGIPDKKLTRFGSYVETDFTEMMSLNMLTGSRRGLDDMHSIMLSKTLAKDLFGGEDPMNRMITLNENTSVKVTGIFEDYPHNSSFSDVTFLAPWELYTRMNGYAGQSIHAWDENSWQIFVQLREGSDFKTVSDMIRDIRMKLDNPPGYKPEFFLHPMSKWHLYSDFKNGVNTGGLITYVWLFGMIGVFVLVLACINFMNLATARSEKRAKEVGLRKSVGSVRSQLIAQFLCESWLTVFLSFVISIVLVQLVLPFFNEIAAKQVEILWTNPWFWLMGLLFLVITGLLAGSYPALYLSSFIPVKVLKGTFAPGRLASLPRKILVVVQFTVSITLMIGIVVVFRQIDFARNRPVGYNHSGLIEIGLNTPHLRHHFDALRNDLLNSGAIAEIGGSNISITSDYGGTTNISWKGKVPDTQPLLMSNKGTHEFGTTVGWKVIDGRDFSRDLVTDTTAMILNEAAASLMGFEDPKGEVVTTGGKEYTIIGVVGDFIKESPFTPVKPSFFTLSYKDMN